MLREEIFKYLKNLSEVYQDLGGAPFTVSICGGAALNILGLVERVTKDIDLVFPEHLSKTFREAIEITAKYFGLKPDWINQGPVDLLKMGLPDGYFERCQNFQLGGNITWMVASRFDQIHFKLYASLDRGGYHIQDLLSLNPSSEEIAQAVRWCFTHDVSETFKQITREFLEKQGWHDVVRNIFQKSE